MDSLIYRLIRNLVHKPDVSLLKAEKCLGYTFKNISLLRIALTHRSLEPEATDNYERLEFLGDAVIDHFVSHWLYQKYHDMDEGFLTQHRSALVNKQFLASMSISLGIHEYVLADSSVRLDDDKVAKNILGDVFESVIGAVFLDGGIRPTSIILQQTVIENEQLASFNANFKGQLIEYCHKQDLRGPVFRTINARGPEHKKTFEIEVSLGDGRNYKGFGKSKKSAEQEAARIALKKLVSDNVA